MERCTRPWGWYETLTEGEGYLVKRLWLEPGQRLSLQRHQHRRHFKQERMRTGAWINRPSRRNKRTLPHNEVQSTR